MDLKSDMIKSLRLQYESEIQKAKTTVKIYFGNSVGIGEHPQHLEEIDKQIEIISTNEDKLEALNKHFVVKKNLFNTSNCTITNSYATGNCYSVNGLNISNCFVSSNYCYNDTNDPYAGVNY